MARAKKRPSIKTKAKKNMPQITDNQKKKIIIGGIAVVIVVLGIIIGVVTFFATTSAKLSISDDAKSSLITTQENQPFYTLLSIDTNDEPDGIADMFVLYRTDPRDKQFILITIPVDTYVASQSGGGTTLAKISNNDAELITAVSSFAEAGINHYIKLNNNAFCQIIDEVGGIDVNLKEQTDDPSVGKTYIPAGESTLNSEQTTTLLRSKNYNGGNETIASNQREIARGLLKAVMNNTKSDPVMLIDKLAGDIKSDMTTGDFINMQKKYEGIDDEDILDTSVPGFRTTRNNEMVFVIDASCWKNIKTQMSYGTLPGNESNKTLKDVDTSSFTIQIQNGSGVDGSGAMLADKLKNEGCTITETGNADSNNYNDTLIIYKGEKFKEAAQAIKGSINNGRIVNGEGLYDMKTDILIIIGKDFKI